MEEDYLKQYQEAWQKDADDLLDKVAPPMEELLKTVERRERQRRSRRMAFISGIAAMLVLVVTLIFVSRPASPSASPVVATLPAEEQEPATDHENTTTPMPEVQPMPQQQPALDADLALAAPQRQANPAVPPAVQPTAGSASSPNAAVLEAMEQMQHAESYVQQSNFEVAYLNDYYIDSVHSAPATVITAKDSAAWEWLRTQFAQLPEDAAGSRVSSQFVQRDYQLSDKNQEPAGLDIDTGTYFLSALPNNRAIVVIHYESVPDLIDLLNPLPSNYAENDTQLLQQPRRAKQKLPKDHEKVPNRHNVRIKNPTYYQAITPSGQSSSSKTPKGYQR